MKYINVIIFALLIVCIYLISEFLFFPSSTVKIHYKNFEEIMLDDAINKGIFPSFLPKSVKNISVLHDIDLNTLYIEFEYDLMDFKSFIDSKKWTELSDKNVNYFNNVSKENVLISNYIKLDDEISCDNDNKHNCAVVLINKNNNKAILISPPR